MPWLPLIAIAFGVEIAPTPEVEMLAEGNRRAKLHETVGRFLEAVVPEQLLVEIENAHHMDEASAELLAYLTGEIGARPWLFAVARRASGSGFGAPEAPDGGPDRAEAARAADALRLAQLATKETPLPAHVLEVVATRSGGNPQFLRDLLRTAIDSGGIADLPDSAEAATMAQIDALAPEDRALVRRAAVFGITFHPRMLAWLDGEERRPRARRRRRWNGCGDLFDEEPDGYLRFRRSLLRDAAYEGLPFKLRRQLHGAVAAHLEEEMDFPEEAAGMLSLHYFEAGEYAPAWRYATAAGEACRRRLRLRRSRGALFARAGGGAQAPGPRETRSSRALHEALGRCVVPGGGVPQGVRRLHRPRAGWSRAIRWPTPSCCSSSRTSRRSSASMRRRCAGPSRLATCSKDLPGREAARQAARASAWYASVLQAEGRTDDALEWAERAVARGGGGGRPGGARAMRTS